MALTTGDYQAAVAYCEDVLKTADADDKLNIMFARYVMASATYSQGKAETAFDHAREAYQTSRELGDDYFGSCILIVMGNVAQAMQDYDRAREYYEHSHRLKSAFYEFGGMAFALNSLARIAWLRGEYQQAKNLFQQGYDLYQDVDDPGGIATSIFGLGDTAQAQGDFATGRSYFQQALEIAADIRWKPLILAILAGVGDLFVKTGEPAANLLALAAQHPVSEPPTRHRAEQLLTKHGRLSGEMPDLEITMRRVINDLLKPGITQSPAKFNAGQNSAKQAKDDSVDGLSDREIEILALLAEGLTNQEIAERLVLVVGTVKAHNNHIFGKLGVSNRVQAIARARELGLI